MSEANGDLRGLGKHRSVVSITLAELAKPVLIRAWSGRERLRYERDLATIEKEKQNELRGLEFAAISVAHSVIGEDGSQLYMDPDPDKPGELALNREALNDLMDIEYAVLRRIYKQVKKIQGLDEELDESDEDAEGN